MSPALLPSWRGPLLAEVAMPAVLAGRPRARRVHLLGVPDGGDGGARLPLAARLLRAHRLDNTDTHANINTIRL